jgi:copper homeostasis protein (lipoprotein)
MNRKSRVRISFIVAFFGVVFGLGCSSAARGGTITGTATFLERIALPPDAILEVSLQDVSRADAPAVELGRARIENPGSPPFSFEIAYDAEKIDERHSYAVRATIRAGGQLLFSTNTVFPVLTRSAGTEVELLLRRVVGEHRESENGPLGDLPASFEGELPCADCPGIFYHLDLFQDQMFFLRTTYLGRGTGAIFDNVGSWETTGDRSRLTLFGGEENPLFFRIVDRDTLRKLDLEGRDIESSLNYDLRRKDGAALIEPRLTMRGMYRYMADAALFEECLSGRRFQVAQEADNIALERAYLEARREPGEPLLVSLQGRIAERHAMEGDAMVLTVVPERFLGVWPGETCGARRSVSPLENIYLKLTRLGDHGVPVFEGQREAHIVLHSEEQRVAGTGGCNRFSGTYEIEGSLISFGVMAITKMACLESKDVDLALMAALEKVASFRKTAHHLELLDEEGSTVARFEARELQ